jgi:hypothetical protein
MATFFRNHVETEIGTDEVVIYETASNERSTIIGLSLTNLTQDFVYVDVQVTDDQENKGFYIKQALIAANTSLRVVTDGEKLILAPDNKISVTSSSPASVDAILSYVEVV